MSAIVVGTDGSAEAEKAVRRAISSERWHLGSVSAWRSTDEAHAKGDQ